MQYFNLLPVIAVAQATILQTSFKIYFHNFHDQIRHYINCVIKRSQQHLTLHLCNQIATTVPVLDKPCCFEPNFSTDLKYRQHHLSRKKSLDYCNAVFWFVNNFLTLRMFNYKSLFDDSIMMVFYFSI